MKFGNRKIVSTIALFLIAILGYTLGWSNLISVRKIDIQGKDPAIIAQISSQLAIDPAVVKIGQPLARVDKREIVTRLRQIIWIDGVSVRRNLITGTISIAVTPRTPLLRLDGGNSNQANQGLFLSTDLSTFTISAADIARAANAGTWQTIPRLTNPGIPPREQLLDLQSFLTALEGSPFNPIELSISKLASGQTGVKSSVAINGQKMDISWGSVKDLKLKIEVAQRLLSLPENAKIRSIDLSNPVSPTVR